MARPQFSFASFLVRWLVALVLVFATFNPTEYSYYRWVAGWDGANMALKTLAGVVLLILFLIFLRATWRSIGPIGVILAAALLGPRLLVDIVDVGLAGDPAADVRPGNPHRQNRRGGEQNHPGHDRRPGEVEDALLRAMRAGRAGCPAGRCPA